jgi:hypothetical protein
MYSAGCALHFTYNFVGPVYFELLCAIRVSWFKHFPFLIFALEAIRCRYHDVKDYESILYLNVLDSLIIVLTSTSTKGHGF